MSNQLVPADIESLRLRTREFIRATVFRSESCPGRRLEQATWDRLQATAEAAAVFAPHVPSDFGGPGVPTSVLFAHLPGARVLRDRPIRTELQAPWHATPVGAGEPYLANVYCEPAGVQ